MELKGKIHRIFDTQKVSENFSKREIVIANDDNPYRTQYIKLELQQDKTEIINPFSVGQSIEAAFDIRGREWEAPSGEIKYFNTLVAWKITALSNEPDASIPPPPPEVIDVSSMDDDDELPF